LLKSDFLFPLAVNVQNGYDRGLYDKLLEMYRGKCTQIYLPPNFAERRRALLLRITRHARLGTTKDENLGAPSSMIMSTPSAFIGDPVFEVISPITALQGYS
jgi:hypothetical protein